MARPSSLLYRMRILLKKWSQQWKMTFNPVFLRRQSFSLVKIRSKIIMSRFFKENKQFRLAATSTMLFLSFKLSSDEHLITLIIKLTISIGFLCEFLTSLPRKLLLTIYKPFLRSYLVHVHDTYDRCSINYFMRD